MTAFTPDRERRLLPRFRASAAAVASGDLQAVIKKGAIAQPAAPAPHFEALKKEWGQTNDLAVATELVCTASVLGRGDEVREAAELIVRESAEVNTVIQDLAVASLNMGLGPGQSAPVKSTLMQEAQIRSSLAALKRRLSVNPRNAIAWMDRAHMHTLLGQQKPAAHAIGLAIALAPNDRFVVRGASRFFVHADDNEAGLQVLRRTPRLRTDPWLMAAEVALSTVSNQTPMSIGRARELLTSDRFNPWHTGELNGAMGTLAMRDRGIGKPAQFFRRSLRAPTENAIAQAQWFANLNASFDVQSTSVNLQASPEAEALKARAEKRWLDTIQACHEWMMMDPTSTRPLILAGFVACVALYDGTIALPFTRQWTRIAPDSSGAWNNHTVALVYANRMAEAKTAFKRVARQDSKSYPDTVYLATKGLLAHRSGDIVEGRKLYEEAAETRRAQADPCMKALVWWHLLREEARIGTPNAKELIESAWTKSKALPILELDAMKLTAEQSMRKTIGSRIVATFQGSESATLFSIPKWD